MMNFFMDEIYVASTLENLAQKIHDFEKLTETMNEISSCPLLKLHYIHDLHSQEFEGKSFAELLYAHYSDGDFRDTILMFDLALERGECTDLETGRRLESCTVELTQKGMGGCLTGSEIHLEDWWVDEGMCAVLDMPSFTIGLRKLFIKNGFQTDLLAKLSHLMFPAIYFHAEIVDLDRMGISHREHATSIMKHLGYLNDYAISDFKSDSPAQIIQLAASKGVEISPESPNTHSNLQAMSRRRIEINSTELTCEWHTKITYNKGRIHFHARPSTHHENIVKKTQSKLIIGIIAEHLPT